METFSINQKQRFKWFLPIIVIIAIGHIMLLWGASEVVGSIRGELNGRKVLNVALFGEKPAAAPPAPGAIPERVKLQDATTKPVRALPKTQLPESVKTNPATETDVELTNLSKAPPTATEVTGDSLKSTSSDAAINTAATDQTKASDATVTPTTIGEPTSASQIKPEPSLPKVSRPKMPQKYVFEAYQGDAADGKSVGKVLFDLEAREAGYQSQFSIQFNWATRWLADDRQWISQGSLTDEGLVPIRITEQRGKRPAKLIELDRAKNTGRTGEQSFVIKAGLQDRTSMIWQMGLLAQAESERFIQGVDLDVPMLVSSKMVISKWRTKIETVVIGERSFSALHFIRLDQRDDDLRFEFWLLPEQEMAPIKLTISDGKGRRFDVVRVATQ